ncbi:MAG: hypothetical protein ACRDZ7_14325 [Acidimicrobiia bacterium]
MRMPRSGILRDPTLRSWPSQGCPDDCEQGTFATRVADSLLGAFRDPNVVLRTDQPLRGGATYPVRPVPPDLAGLDFVAVHDPGDHPDYQGLDWVTWLVFFEEHDSRRTVAGLAFDAWET